MILHKIIGLHNGGNVNSIKLQNFNKKQIFMPLGNVDIVKHLQIIGVFWSVICSSRWHWRLPEFIVLWTVGLICLLGAILSEDNLEILTCLQYKNKNKNSRWPLNYFFLSLGITPGKKSQEKLLIIW